MNILELFLKDHVALNTGFIILKIQLFHHRENNNNNNNNITVYMLFFLSNKFSPGKH